MDEPSIVAVPVNSKGTLERVRIKRANGQVIDLGKPGTLMFRFRLWQYKRKLGVNNG